MSHYSDTHNTLAPYKGTQGYTTLNSTAGGTHDQACRNFANVPFSQLPEHIQDNQRVWVEFISRRTPLKSHPLRVIVVSGDNGLQYIAQHRERPVERRAS